MPRLLEWSGRLSWNETENLEWKQNWTAKSTNLKENAGKVNSIFLIRAALWAEKLAHCLKHCRSWSRERQLENLWLQSTLGAIRLEFWTKGALMKVEMCPLCRLEILKPVWYSVRDTLQLWYSWPWAVPSYTLFPVVPWNRLENSCWKAMLIVYFNCHLKRDVLMFHSWHQSVSTMTENFSNKLMSQTFCLLGF